MFLMSTEVTYTADYKVKYLQNSFLKIIRKHPQILLVQLMLLDFVFENLLFAKM